MELAGSLLALFDALETATGCDSAVLSPFEPTRSPSLNKKRPKGVYFLGGFWSQRLT